MIKATDIVGSFSIFYINSEIHKNYLNKYYLNKNKFF